MKKILLLCALYSVLIAKVSAQKKWEYGFGSLNGVVNDTKNTSVTISRNETNELLPIPAESQVISLRVGNNKENNGGFNVSDSGTEFGTGAKLVMTAPQGSSTNKFSITRINGTPLFAVSFHVKFDSGSKGNYKFAIGKDVDGKTPFSNAYNFSATAALPTFLILQWDISKTGYRLSVQQKDKSLSGIDASLNPAISFVNGKEYRVQVYANNTAEETMYFHQAKEYKIAAGASQIWIDDKLLLKSAGEPNFFTAELPAKEIINAFVFLGEGTDNAKAYFDDFVYANYIKKLVRKIPQKNANAGKAEKLDPVWGTGSISSYQKTASLFGKTDIPNPDVLKILSCNVLKGFSGDLAIELAFQEWINERKPDVIAIQELNGFNPKRLEEFAKKMGFPYAVMHKEEGYPLGLLSKYPISNVKKIKDGMRHGILSGKILDYNFIITHLVSYTYQQRIKEVDSVVLKLVNDIPKNEKIIMMGDFNNMSPEDKQYYDNNPEKMKALVNSEKNNPGNTYLKNGKIDYTTIQKVLDAGFYDTYRIFNKHYDKSAPTKMKNHNNYTRIDYIWVNKNAKPDCVDMFIVKDQLTDYMSDHYPTLLILKKEKK
ncbi:endonuclease/exonuclease/phosphatase family protein [Pedobacter xixiisoli]|uniref:Exonuclease III n=1 Tax=Pedobacter xixiisoli TaxID=1476464 RepID=A0A286AF33_9SPHI|nr:endonuclease/exonuclease/phosphatase family protein [Pedobacter xixiisoli]SOD20514.1 Exonuclease III [Pedobacter xixiisoli]